jgi:hypothetical protein
MQLFTPMPYHYILSAKYYCLATLTYWCIYPMKIINYTLIMMLLQPFYSCSASKKSESLKSASNMAMLIGGIGIASAASYSLWRQWQEPKILKKIKKIQYREKGYDYAKDADRVAAVKKELSRLSTTQISEITLQNLRSTAEEVAQGEFGNQSNATQDRTAALKLFTRFANDFDAIPYILKPEYGYYDPEDAKTKRETEICKFFISLKQAQKATYNPKLNVHTFGKGLLATTGLGLACIGLQKSSPSTFNTIANLAMLCGGIGVYLYSRNQIERIVNHNHNLNKIDLIIKDRDSRRKEFTLTTSKIKRAVASLSPLMLNSLSRRKLYSYADLVTAKDYDNNDKEINAPTIQELIKLEADLETQLKKDDKDSDARPGALFIKHFKHARAEDTQKKRNRYYWSLYATAMGGLLLIAKISYTAGSAIAVNRLSE